MSALQFASGGWSYEIHELSEGFSGIVYDEHGQAVADHLSEQQARLIAAAPDHALIGWAMCVQDATWEEWGEGKGEFCFAGLRHATTLDEFGCPVLTENLRERLSEARGDQTKETPK